ncbi:MAG TPA: NifB/NifX family molybdenum-iron cluster-binding protein [Treponemataceae bacterium]|nr:NifB/NifX family molybdenum-iron cluster-binding protein [Treponemataceae bacterium]
MKIAIPADDDKKSVSMSFGRCPLYAIADSETGEMNFIKNTAANAPGGAGIKASQSLVDAGVNVVLTPRCGQNAADVLKAANIAMFKTTSNSLDGMIRAYKAGTLEALNDVHPGYHGHGG